MRAAIVRMQARADGRGTAGCTVVKIGGGLLADPNALEQVCEGLGRARARGTPLVVVPGGGPFADTVRAVDQRWSLGADAAHWMAIHGMDQYGHWLHAKLPGSVLVDSPYLAGVALDEDRLAVLAPARWLRDTDTLPHSWRITSDAIAGYVAGALDAARLVLVKPVEGDPDDLADPLWRTTTPRGLRVDVIAADAPDLAARLAH